MRIVYNARWHLSTGTSRTQAKSAIYHECRTHFRDPGLYVEIASRKQLPGAVECGRAGSRKFQQKIVQPRRGPRDRYSGVAFGLY
jgi:hypothetical protein